MHAGDHVELKGVLLDGYTGTLVRRSKLFRFWRVRLDAPQVRGGNTMITVTRHNIRSKSRG
jgi:hypothetical protein